MTASPALPPALLTVRQTAAVLGRSQRWVREEAAGRRLPAIFESGAWHVSSVAAYGWAARRLRDAGHPTAAEATEQLPGAATDRAVMLASATLAVSLAVAADHLTAAREHGAARILQRIAHALADTTQEADAA